MQQFRINTELRPADTEFHLNDNWKLLISWFRSSVNYHLGLLSIRIKNCRKLPSEEFSISGELSARADNRTILNQRNFSLIMKGSKCIGLCNIRIQLPKVFMNYYLYGSITITSNCKECTSVTENGEGVNCSTTPIYQPNFLVQLSNDFERLLDPQTSCFMDVNLICGSDSIPAHKVILSARSPVFAAIFKHPMKETHTNKVNITDIDASVLRTMITYIYTGKVPSLSVSSASDLLFAADKYELQELKEICCDFLKKNITFQNVLEILVLGDIHAENLKSFAMKYISEKCMNFSEFEVTEEWKALKKERPTLAMDVLAFLVNSRDKK